MSFVVVVAITVVFSLVVVVPVVLLVRQIPVVLFCSGISKIQVRKGKVRIVRKKEKRNRKK